MGNNKKNKASYFTGLYYIKECYHKHEILKNIIKFTFSTKNKQIYCVDLWG